MHVTAHRCFLHSHLALCFFSSLQVQGVFFRASAQDEAQRLGLVGWVANTWHGTVVGEAQGTVEALNDFRHWLTNVGSRRSKMTRCDISKEREIAERTYKGFNVADDRP